MAYKNPVYDLTTAYYDLLNGISVDVYKEQAPTDIATDFVLIRAESQSTPEKNNSAFFTSVIVIVEIVTFFNTSINSKTLNDIDEEINNLIFPSENSFGITLTNHQINDIRLQSSSYLPEDGVYRKILRYENIVNQN